MLHAQPPPPPSAAAAGPADAASATAAAAAAAAAAADGATAAGAGVALPAGLAAAAAPPAPAAAAATAAAATAATTAAAATIAAEGSCPTGCDQAFHRHARTDRGGRQAVQPRRGSGAGTEVPGYLRSAGVTVWASTAVCSAYRARVLQVRQERAYCQGLQSQVGMRPSAEAAPTC